MLGNVERKMNERKDRNGNGRRRRKNKAAAREEEEVEEVEAGNVFSTLRLGRNRHDDWEIGVASSQDIACMTDTMPFHRFAA